MESRVLQVASSFTAIPLARTLGPLVAKAGMADAVAFAQYAQMTEYMLGDAVTAPNIVGSLVLLRMEDWLREDVKPEAREISERRLARNCGRAWKTSSGGWVRCRAGVSRCGFWDALRRDGLRRSTNPGRVVPHPDESAGGAGAKPAAGNHSEVAGGRAEEIADRNADRLGQIPFSTEGFRRIAESVGEQLEQTLAAGQPARVGLSGNWARTSPGWVCGGG